jgi:hypothetical protein
MPPRSKLDAIGQKFKYLKTGNRRLRPSFAGATREIGPENTSFQGLSASSAQA